MSIRKDYRALLRQARKLGCTTGTTRNGHLRVLCPNGDAVFASGSPSDQRAVLNFRSQLRRAGVDIDRDEHD